MLEAAGWAVQDARAVNLAASRGVAVREFVMKRPHGRADYLLFLDGRAAGVVEAKKEGETLTGVEQQSAKYVDGLPDELEPAVEGGARRSSTSRPGRRRGSRTGSTPSRRAGRCSRSTGRRRSPAGSRRSAATRTRRRCATGCAQLPELQETGLWPAQFRAIANLERSLAANRPRALIQMATGSGKTFTAANVCYRLVKHADARRILFLVDRANLGRQTLKEFQGFTTPDDGRKFTELYNVQHLSSNKIDPVARVAISTIQRRLLDPARRARSSTRRLDEHSAYELRGRAGAGRVQPGGPAGDVRRRDRGRVPPLDLRALAAGARLLRRLHDRADRDAEQAGVRVLQPEPRDGVRARAGGRRRGQRPLRRLPHPHRDHRAGLDDRRRHRHRSSASARPAGRAGRSSTRTSPTPPSQLDRAVVARDQIRTVLETFRDRLFTEIFPGRSEVPKTLIFAKDDAHADEIVQIAREVFGKGNDFAAKITYKATGKKADELIAAFRNTYNPRIAVTVDMIATGTDVKPLECVFFMRSVKSRTYFEQMKGRGVRVIGDADFQAVTPDAGRRTGS